MAEFPLTPERLGVLSLSFRLLSAYPPFFIFETPLYKNKDNSLNY